MKYGFLVLSTKFSTGTFFMICVHGEMQMDIFANIS